MPHLIVSDSLLQDGNAGLIYEFVAKHEHLSRTPIVVKVEKKAKEHIEPLVGKKFAAIILGDVKPELFVGKICSVLATYSLNSPFFFMTEEISISGQMSLSVDATVVGQSDDHLVIRSSMSVDSQNKLICLPAKKQFDPAILSMGENVKVGEDSYNIFPMHKIVGKGIMWMRALPDIMIKSNFTGSNKRVLFFDPSPERFEEMQEILQANDFSAIHANSLSRVISYMKNMSDEFDCIYLYELSNNASGIEWKQAYKEIPANKRHPVIICTSSINAKSTANEKYLKKPFGIGQLINTLDAVFKGMDLSRQNNSFVGGNSPLAKFMFASKLIGVDEVGGIIETKFPVDPNETYSISHPQLQLFWDENCRIRISKISPSETSPGTWILRFEAVTTGSSRGKYYSALLSLIKSGFAGDKSA